MYNRFFGLELDPFNVNPDPRFLFNTNHTEEALACLNYGITKRKGFILLTGEVGTGKTTLLYTLLEKLRSEKVATAFVFNPRLDPDQFLDFMLTDFGIPPVSSSKSQVLSRLNQWLLDRYSSGETAALIVDEAQHLQPDVLEEIRLLTNLETATDKLLQIVLCGQPELEATLKKPGLRQLRQRITLRAQTRPLTPDETAEYINRRLRIAGATDPIFTPSSISSIFRFSRGIPRLVNLLCEHALISAYADQRKSVEAVTIENIAIEFGLEEDLPLVDEAGLVDAAAAKLKRQQ